MQTKSAALLLLLPLLFRRGKSEPAAAGAADWEQLKARLRASEPELVLGGMALGGNDDDDQGGAEPFDYEHPIRCLVCRREGTAYVRQATYLYGTPNSYQVDWFRTEPGWTLQLPVHAGGEREGYRCPDHSFPPPPAKFGPPVPPRLRVKPGWYWYWVRPGDDTIAWNVMLGRWGGPPLYVLHSRKSWKDAFLGSIELFEVVGDELIWSMPYRGRPKPAAKGAETTLFDILAEGP